MLPKIEDHLKALREALNILLENKLYTGIELGWTPTKYKPSRTGVRCGDRVYLSTQNPDHKQTGLPNATKFGTKWIGQYIATRRIHNHAYDLNILSDNKLHPVFNSRSLKPYTEPSRMSRPHEVIMTDDTVA
ncbi:hypothetical protein PHMEG_00011296 [Phytophthora megakarya]|uniref:Tf2-1-like SH3-like domain-containing protein n=1 Tax=Phytophthora megakarya TaxID=4795 RepID=A0A225WDM7_9STRA|nr:hypothetical protein PHMEG_00011296 [Phytophthora megakarya]